VWLDAMYQLTQLASLVAHPATSEGTFTLNYRSGAHACYHTSLTYPAPPHGLCEGLRICLIPSQAPVTEESAHRRRVRKNWRGRTCWRSYHPFPATPMGPRVSALAKYDHHWITFSDRNHCVDCARCYRSARSGKTGNIHRQGQHLGGRDRHVSSASAGLPINSQH